MPRSQRWAASPSILGCHSIDTVKGAIVNGSAKLRIPSRSVVVCLSGTVAIKSVSRAIASAATFSSTPLFCQEHVYPGNELR